MYYFFKINKKFVKINDEYLYNVMKKLKNIKKENYCYGIVLYKNICELFEPSIILNYISKKNNTLLNNNKIILDKYNFIEVRKSCCNLCGTKYLKEFLCILYIYSKNIFICNFDKNEYCWITDIFKQLY